MGIGPTGGIFALFISLKYLPIMLAQRLASGKQAVTGQPSYAPTTFLKNIKAGDDHARKMQPLAGALTQPDFLFLKIRDREDRDLRHLLSHRLSPLCCCDTAFRSAASRGPKPLPPAL